MNCEIQIHWTDHNGRWQYKWCPAKKLGTTENGRIAVEFEGKRVLKSPLDVRVNGVQLGVRA